MLINSNGNRTILMMKNKTTGQPVPVLLQSHINCVRQVKKRPLQIYFRFAKSSSTKIAHCLLILTLSSIENFENNIIRRMNIYYMSFTSADTGYWTTLQWTVNIIIIIEDFHFIFNLNPSIFTYFDIISLPTVQFSVEVKFLFWCVGRVQKPSFIRTTLMLIRICDLNSNSIKWLDCFPAIFPSTHIHLGLYLDFEPSLKSMYPNCAHQWMINWKTKSQYFGRRRRAFLGFKRFDQNLKIKNSTFNSTR